MYVCMYSISINQSINHQFHLSLGQVGINIVGHAWRELFDTTLDGPVAKHAHFRTQGLHMSGSIRFAQQKLPSTDQRLDIE
jgi:hypothetical protein